MSDRTAEIGTAVKTAGAGEALSRAEQCLESARDKYETAARHGWDGVAGTMELAVQALEGVVEQLNSAEQASQTAAGVVDEITHKLSSAEVGAYLVSASGELESAHSAAEASIGLLDEAVGYCLAAGQQTIPVALNSLRDEILEITERLRPCRTDVDAEQQSAEDFGQQSGGDDNLGKLRRVARADLPQRHPGSHHRRHPSRRRPSERNSVGRASRASRFPRVHRIRTRSHEVILQLGTRMTMQLPNEGAVVRTKAPRSTPNTATTSNITRISLEKRIQIFKLREMFSITTPRSKERA